MDPASLMAGYWIIQGASLDAAIGLMKSAPMGGATVEILLVPPGNRL